MNDRLYRSRDDRMLAGVAGGLADMWDADPSLVRIVWALLVPLTGGIALVVYIIMAIVVPEEDDVPVAMPMAPASPTSPDVASAQAATSGGGPEPAVPGWVPPYDQRFTRSEARAVRRAARRERRRSGSGAAPMLIGGILVLLGVWFLVREYIPTFDFDWFWPVVLIGLGVVVLVMAIDRNPNKSGGPPTDPGATQ